MTGTGPASGRVVALVAVAVLAAGCSGDHRLDGPRAAYGAAVVACRAAGDREAQERCWGAALAQLRRDVEGKR